MSIKFTLESLTEWVRSLMDRAKKDDQFSVSWFPGTKNEPFNIVGGWVEGFSEDYSDLLYISKSEPEYAMCIKIVENEGPYAYVDFETLNMPYDRETNEVDDTCIALEYEDNPEETAAFFLGEWERIMKEHGEQ
jgi:hypothetical protein